MRRSRGSAQSERHAQFRILSEPLYSRGHRGRRGLDEVSAASIQNLSVRADVRREDRLARLQVPVNFHRRVGAESSGRDQHICLRQIRRQMFERPLAEKHDAIVYAQQRRPHSILLDGARIAADDDEAKIHLSRYPGERFDQQVDTLIGLEIADIQAQHRARADLVAQVTPPAPPWIRHNPERPAAR